MLRPGPEAIRLFSPVALPGVHVIDADNCSRLWKYYHETYTICTTLAGYHSADDHWRGHARIRYRRRSHQVVPGSVFFFEPGEAHATVFASGPADFRVLCIDPVSAERDWREQGGPGVPHFGSVHSMSRRTFQRFRHLHACLNRPGSLLEQESGLLQCVSELFDVHMETHSHRFGVQARPAVELVREYLEDNFAENVSLGDLERITGLSRFYLEHAFRGAMGVPIHEYQIQVRLGRAREQICRGVPLNQIDAGFCDQAHLTRHFKRVVGVTPGQFRDVVLR